MENFDYIKAYREMLIEEDGEGGGGDPNPPTSSAENAPEGAMSSGSYMDQFHWRPQIAAYNTITKKKKKFKNNIAFKRFITDNKKQIMNKEIVFIDNDINENILHEMSKSENIKFLLKEFDKFNVKVDNNVITLTELPNKMNNLLANVKRILDKHNIKYTNHNVVRQSTKSGEKTIIEIPLNEKKKIS